MPTSVQLAIVRLHHKIEKQKNKETLRVVTLDSWLDTENSFPAVTTYLKDSTFKFERKQNRLERYDRNVTENTLKAIRKIDRIKVDREAKHIKKRIKGKKANEQREGTKELEQYIHLVKAPAVLDKEPSLTLPIKVKVSPKQSDENPMEE
ncbi:probable ribosome biogenesis protein RLP24 [Lycium barbarum]|uniref:probable ribosome biogenesis protein RLP24 n=1 Tax=Lycium barbarum TaxID=112863 RepID=UPI00293E5A56|nr:probable ribosome biogenesis protein RLP24 [Lycium barbarum]